MSAIGKLWILLVIVCISCHKHWPENTSSWLFGFVEAQQVDKKTLESEAST